MINLIVFFLDCAACAAYERMLVPEQRPLVKSYLVFRGIQPS